MLLCWWLVSFKVILGPSDPGTDRLCRMWASGWELYPLLLSPPTPKRAFYVRSTFTCRRNKNGVYKSSTNTRAKTTNCKNSLGILWHRHTHNRTQNYKFCLKLSSQIPFWLHLVQFIIGLASLVSFRKLLPFHIHVKQSVRPHLLLLMYDVIIRYMRSEILTRRTNSWMLSVEIDAWLHHKHLKHGNVHIYRNDRKMKMSFSFIEIREIQLLKAIECESET